MLFYISLCIGPGKTIEVLPFGSREIEQVLVSRGGKGIQSDQYRQIWQFIELVLCSFEGQELEQCRFTSPRIANKDAAFVLTNGLVGIDSIANASFKKPEAFP